MHLIPEPQEIERRDGYFTLTGAGRIVLDTSCGIDDLEAALLIQGEIADIGGFAPSIVKAFHRERGGIYLTNDGRDDESYALTVSAEGVGITGGGVGLFYGAQTLRQILRAHGLRIPCLQITDRPHFPYRGFLHDVSRGRVPTLDSLMALADRAAFYKLNQIQLYVEHTFAFSGMGEVWAGADALTAEEIVLYDAYCRKRHIDLIPSLATFGHMYAILSSDMYHHLCELAGSNTRPYSAVGRMQHHTLDVSNPESIALVERMIGEYAPLFSSGYFNINCDETFDLGKGRSRSLVRERGRGRAYLDFMLRVADIVKGHGKQVMFWGDIILEHPEYLKDIPKDIVALNWDYGPEPDGARVKTIADSGLAQYVCPGVWGWRRVMNDMDSSFLNIRRMIGHGAEYGARGVLNTDWGDFGHINLPAGSMPGMIYGAGLSWNPRDTRSDEAMDTAISIAEYGDDRVMGLLRELGRQQPARWEHVVFWDEAKLIGEDDVGGPPPDILDCEAQKLYAAYHRALEIEKELFALLPHVRNDRKRDIRELCCAAKGVALINAFALAVKRYQYGQGDVLLAAEPGSLAEALEYWFIEYAALWRSRNKESELYRIREVVSRMCGFLRKQEEV